MIDGSVRHWHLVLEQDGSMIPRLLITADSFEPITSGDLALLAKDMEQELLESRGDILRTRQWVMYQAQGAQL